MSIFLTQVVYINIDACSVTCDFTFVKITCKCLNKSISTNVFYCVQTCTGKALVYNDKEIVRTHDNL